MKNPLHPLLTVAALLTLPVQAEFRKWTNPDGATLDAEFVKAEGGNVTLRLRNGRLSTFSATKLSQPDQEFITAQAAATAEKPAAAAAVDPARKAKWLTKMDRAKEQAAETGLPILVLFTGTSWCPYCIKLEEAVFSEKDFKSFADQNLVLLMLDYGPGGTAQSSRDEKLKKEYGVTGFPTYFLTDASGKKLAQGGYHDGITPEVFANWVQKSAPKR